MIDKTKILWETVRDSIRAEIISGSLKVGDRIPSIYNAAKKYKVSEGVVIKAYNSLERDGFIYKVGCKGAYVSEHPLTSKQKSNDDLMSQNKIDTLTNECISGMADTLNLIPLLNVCPIIQML